MSADKKIIAVRGRPKSGKTTVIRQVYELIKNKCDIDQEYCFAHKIDNYPEIIDVVCVGGVKIGIQSMGDNGDRVTHSLKLFANENCDLIICATRSKGSTVKAVKYYKDEYCIDWKRRKRVDGNDDNKICKANKKTANKIFAEVQEFINS